MLRKRKGRPRIFSWCNVNSLLSAGFSVCFQSWKMLNKNPAILLNSRLKCLKPGAFLFLFFYFWPHWLSVAAHRLLVAALGLSLVAASRAYSPVAACGLQSVGSIVVVHNGLSCPISWRIPVPRPGIEPVSPALEGRFLTTGPPGKSLELFSMESFTLAEEDAIGASDYSHPLDGNRSRVSYTLGFGQDYTSPPTGEKSDVIYIYTWGFTTLCVQNKQFFRYWACLIILASCPAKMFHFLLTDWNHAVTVRLRQGRKRI